jgi:hypothetical protein
MNPCLDNVEQSVHGAFGDTDREQLPGLMLNISKKPTQLDSPIVILLQTEMAVLSVHCLSRHAEFLR